MSIILKPLSDLYKKLVHVEGENAYPWLDRAISYVLPTAGAVLWSAFGQHDDYSLSGFKKGSTGDEIYMHYHQADYLTEALIKI